MHFIDRRIFQNDLSSGGRHCHKIGSGNNTVRGNRPAAGMQFLYTFDTDTSIFQNFNLLDTLTAYENISLALSIAGAKPSEIEQRIPQIAQALNIQDVLGKYPYQMSGGQQQRVAAARAMVTNPAIVLADEPTGALDSNSSRMLLTMLTELNERLSATILMVTHDAFSASYCNRILFIKDGQVFNELHRGTDTRKEFFTKILEVVSVLGGEQSEHM